MHEFHRRDVRGPDGLAWIHDQPPLAPTQTPFLRARNLTSSFFPFKRAWVSDEVGVIALTGAVDKGRFCFHRLRPEAAMETGDLTGPSESGLFRGGAAAPRDPRRT